MGFRKPWFQEGTTRAQRGNDEARREITEAQRGPQQAQFQNCEARPHTNHTPRPGFADAKGNIAHREGNLANASPSFEHPKPNTPTLRSAFIDMIGLRGNGRKIAKGRREIAKPNAIFVDRHSFVKVPQGKPAAAKPRRSWAQNASAGGTISPSPKISKPKPPYL